MSLLNVPLLNIADAINTNYITVAPHVDLLDVINRMSQATSSYCPLSCDVEPTDYTSNRQPFHRVSPSYTCAVVIDQGEIVGILTQRDLVKLVAQGANLGCLTVADVMSSPVIRYQLVPDRPSPVSPPGTSAYSTNQIFQIINQFNQHHIRHLVVLDEQTQLLGIMTPESIRKLINPLDMLRLRTIAEIMTTDVVHLPPHAKVLDVARLMTRQHISCVVIGDELVPTDQTVVADRPAATEVAPMNRPLVRPVGIITEYDIVQFAVLGLDLANQIAADLMSTPLFTLQPHDSLWQAHEVMQHRQFRRLVIIDDHGYLAGILTQTQMLKLLEPESLYEINLILQQRLKEMEAEHKQQLLLHSQTLQVAVDQSTNSLQQQLSREKLIAQISNRIHTSLKLPEILQVTVTEIRRFLGCDRVLVYQFSPTLSEQIVAESVQPPYPSCIQIAGGYTHFHKSLSVAYRVGQNLIIDDLNHLQLPDTHTAFLEQAQVRAKLVVPILLSRSHTEVTAEDPLWGLLVAHQCSAPRYWESSEVETLQELSVQLAIAIQHANMYHQLTIQLQERQHVEAILRQSQQNYVSLTEAVPVGIFRANIHGQTIYVNERWSQMMARPPQSAMGNGWLNAVYTVDRPRVMGAWEECVQTRGQFQMEYRIERPNGEIVWVYGQAVTERDDHGQVTGYVGSITDISDRKQIEETTWHLLDILEAARDIIASAEPSGQITYLNQAGRTLLGVELDEDIFLSSIPDYHPPHIARMLLEQALPECVKTGFWVGETLFRRRDGSEFPAWQIIVPHWREDGTMSHFSTIARDLTEAKRAEAIRQQAEKAVRDSEERLRLALTATQQGLYDYNLQTGNIIVNPEYALMLGYDPAEFQETASRWEQRLHPDDRQRVITLHQRYLNGELPEYQAEFRLQTKTGDWKWVLSLGKIVAWDQDGQPLRMLGTHTDITDRVRLQEERLQAEQTRQELDLLENILDTVLAGYWDWDLLNHQEYLSPGFKRMFGYADHELVNSPDTWQQLIFPEDLPGVFADLEQHINSHGTIPFHREVRYHHKNGSTIWVICSGRVIEWTADGAAKRVIGCHIDITAQKQIEEQLRKSATHLRTAQRIGKLGSWEFDLRTQQIWWSEEVFRIFGLDPTGEPPTYEALHQLFHPDDRAHYSATVQAAIANANCYDLECRFYRPDGSLGYMLARGEPILDETGQLIQLIGTVLDITDRKLAEIQILRTTAQLEASNRELEAFAYSVSHDLRAPLRAIDGFSQALMEDYSGQFDAQGMNYFQRIRTNITRMSNLIDDLLQLSRVSRLAMNYTVINLSKLAERILRDLHETHPDRQVETVIQPEAIVTADATLMRVVLDNLLQNAWKFTSHHATARIEFGYTDLNGERTYFVRDDGAGFNMAYAGMLFGVFQRLHNTNEFPGTGIGLATVQRIINRHGGRIWAEAAVEQGATIYFTLPHTPSTLPLASERKEELL